jgi:hypothetical protein
MLEVDELTFINSKYVHSSKNVAIPSQDLEAIHGKYRQLVVNDPVAI